MMKKFFGGVLGFLLMAAIVIGVIAAILLADAGLLSLLGVRYESFGWLIAYVAISSVVCVPLDLLVNGLAQRYSHWDGADDDRRIYFTFLLMPSVPPLSFGSLIC